MKKGVCIKIKQIRLEKNFSQDYMAIRLGLSQSQYAKVENGVQELTLIRLIQISEILDINPTQLFEELVYDYYIKGDLQLEIIDTKK